MLKFFIANKIDFSWNMNSFKHFDAEFTVKTILSLGVVDVKAIDCDKISLAAVFWN